MLPDGRPFQLPLAVNAQFGGRHRQQSLGVNGLLAFPAQPELAMGEALQSTLDALQLDAHPLQQLPVDGVEGTDFVGGGGPLQTGRNHDSLQLEPGLALFLYAVHLQLLSFVGSCNSPVLFSPPAPLALALRVPRSWLSHVPRFWSRAIALGGWRRPYGRSCTAGGGGYRLLKFCSWGSCPLFNHRLSQKKVLAQRLALAFGVIWLCSSYNLMFSPPQVLFEALTPASALRIEISP